MAIKTLFIANRGEIAVRIVRAAKALGMETVQAYSEADATMLAVKLADRAVCIGPAKAADSYLNVDAVVAAARTAKADAVHPGYGFLAENARFAQAVTSAGMVFVGPSAAIIESMGDKVAARQAAFAAGVPVVPGSDGRIAEIETAVRIAGDIGYPVMIKAAAGGGGRGIRVAANETELRKLAPQAQAEAKAAFGDSAIYLERAIRSPRHIEVQILGDGHDAVHCYERECSLQRRRQKVWEEAGAACLSPAVREKLCASAVELAKSIGYAGAGTLEYLYEEASESFFFIEMNTRIQVEHPVTEMICGIDLVQEMLRIAGGEPLRLRQQDIRPQGHAIEVRINAEDPFLQFMPFPGQVGTLRLPQGDGIRFDHFLYEGYQIPPFYDSLIGKLIVHAATRAQAIDRLRTALGQLEIGGLRTTAPLHVALTKDAEVQAGRFHTQWLEILARGRRAHPTTRQRGGRMKPRYSFGGDEHVYVEIDEEMSLDAFFMSLSMSNGVRDARLDGVTEICPANASFQVRFDPDIVAPDAILAQIKKLETLTENAEKRINTRIIEIPVFYEDPWTHETLMRFRERHQDPSGTDLDYAARINGYANARDFITAHHSQPWFVSMVGFVSGLPFLYQLVAREKQLQVPKYLRPRTDTPKLTVGHGGCFGCIYSVRGAGGYQMFGITPMPIYDPAQEVSYLRDFMVFFKPGDIVKWKPIDHAEYDHIQAAVAAGTYAPRMAAVEFDLAAWKANISGTNAKLMEALNGA